MVARLSALVISEVLNVAHFAGSELFVSDYSFWPSAGAGSRRLLFALLICATIAGYSLTDGIGMRVATTPLSNIPWLIFVQAIPFSLFVL